jgi:hypothetical protein
MMKVQHSENAEILQAAKSRFCRRNHILYLNLFPSMPRKKVRDILLAAWESSPETEKNIYTSEVKYYHNVPTFISYIFFWCPSYYLIGNLGK